VFNNSNTAYTEFIVASSADAALSHVLNYPNPFTTETEFMFEHNLPGSNLDVKVEIFTISGKLIKTIRTNVIGNTNIEDVKNCNNEFSEIGGYRVDGIMWDGRDDFGDLIGKGVYVYRVSIRSDSGLKAEKFEKLVVLK
jgi:flagellar hook assembly protein FlgD